VSSFLPVLRLGLVNPEGYIAFSLFPHLSAIPPRPVHFSQPLHRRSYPAVSRSTARAPGHPLWIRRDCPPAGSGTGSCCFSAPQGWRRCSRQKPIYPRQAWL